MTSKVFFAVVLASLWMFQPAFAEQRSYAIMVEEGGKPLKRNPEVPSSRTTAR